VTVVAAGWGTTVQDHGRPRYVDLGVPRAGAVDRRAHGLANRLVGNPESAAALETLGELTIEADDHVDVAISTTGTRQTLRPGDRLTVSAAAERPWIYVAVRGGITVEPVLGSRSHDTLSGLGPPPIVAGTVLPIGTEPGTEMAADLAVDAAVHGSGRAISGAAIRLWEGPRLDWFDGALDLLVGRRWPVVGDVNRVGIRLGPGPFTPRPRRSAAMPSEGILEGAIQVTPSGEPIVMLANHPTTGGYPVVAVVDPDDQHLVANARPGAELRFRRVG
jgi:biotin-dependent carboxylase-like uncharacterized protein